MSPDFELAADDRRMVAEAIGQILADTLLLAVAAREAAWSAEGPCLPALQTELLAQSDGMIHALDALARRVRSLGFRIPKLLSPARSEGAGSAPDGRETLRDRLTALTRAHGEIAGSLRFVRPVLRDLDDGATALLVDARLADHEASADRLLSLCATAEDEGRRYARLLASTPGDG